MIGTDELPFQNDLIYFSFQNLLKDVANMVAEAEQAKQKELEAEVRNTLGNAVKGLNKKLEITVNKPGAVFKYPKSNILLEKNLKGGVKYR